MSVVEVFELFEGAVEDSLLHPSSKKKNGIR
jgi:hypothetical protein